MCCEDLEKAMHALGGVDLVTGEGMGKLPNDTSVGSSRSCYGLCCSGCPRHGLADGRSSEPKVLWVEGDGSQSRGDIGVEQAIQAETGASRGRSIILWKQLGTH